MATDVVQYALLGLISARPEGTHGYQLKIEFEALYGDFWSLNYGQLYRTIDHTGNQDVFEVIGGAFTVVDRTGALRGAVDWLVRRLKGRDALVIPAACLAFALGGVLDNMKEEIVALVRSQRAIYLHHLARLTKRRTLLEESGQDMFVTRLLLLQADMRVRTDLAWLDLVEKELLQRIEVKKAPRPTPPKHR